MLNMSVLGEPLYYNASELAKFFHSIPHYDLRFDPVPSDFNPGSQPYQESILLIAAVPVLWMLFWIIIYMVYFCYFCVTCRKQRVEKERKNGRPARWFSFFFTMLTILALTASVFGNEIIHKAVMSAESNTAKIKTDTDKVAVQSAVILRAIDLLKDETGSYLHKQYIESGSLDMEADRNMLLSAVAKFKDSLLLAARVMKFSIQPPLMQLEIENMHSSTLKQTDFYRRIASHSLTAFVILTSLLSLCALGTKKKGFILAFVAIAIFNVIVVWAAAGAYSGLSVATADFCVNPMKYLMNEEGSSSDNGKAVLKKASLKYFLECQPATNPLYQHVLRMQHNLRTADDSLYKMTNKAALAGAEVLQNITNARSNITEIMAQILELSSFTECGYSHRSYVSAVTSICDSGLTGETVMIGSFSLAGIFIIILVFLMHATARFSGNSNRKSPTLPVVTQPYTRRRTYFEVDSQDNDFQSRDQHHRSDNPLYYRFSQISTADDNARAGVSTSADVQPTAPPRSSPPPAYQNHKDFYSTYGNNDGTLDSNVRVPTAGNDLNRNSNTFRT